MQQLAGVTANFTVNGTNSMSTNKNLALLSGTAPIAVATILVNGISYPLTWTSVKNWSLRVPLEPGTNLLALQAYDRFGHSISNAAQSISATFEGSEPRPEDFPVINEIMYHPILPGASFVEILNTSTNSAFDLSNWVLKGVDFTFPPGTIMTNRQLIVLAKNREAFAQVYGASIPVLGEFAGELQPAGALLELIKPGSGRSAELVVDGVRFENVPPWPLRPDGAGDSLQLMDPKQDNSRASNWADGLS